MKEEKKRKVVTFNTDEYFYSEYKKILINQKTTPTADLNKHIQKVVEESQSIDSELLSKFNEKLREEHKSYKLTIEEFIKNYLES